MKKLFSICLALAIFGGVAAAQNDPREPGLYFVNGDESTPLTYISAISSNSSTSVLGFEVSKQKIIYKGLTSDTKVPQKATFEMVCDMSKKNIVRTLKKYDVFVSKVTPGNLIIVPLVVKKKNREYDDSVSINGLKMSNKGRVDFTWEMISDNSYRIEADFLPGEYAIVFKPANLGQYDFTAAFDFTVEAGE